MSLGLLAGLGLAFGLPPRYRATTLLAVELTPSPGALSRSTAAEMLRRRLPAITKRVSDSASVERFRGAVDVRVAGANRIELTCVAGAPDRAAAVANRLAALLVEASGPRTPESFRGGSADLEERLTRARRALEKNQQAIDRVRRRGAAEPTGLGTSVSDLPRLRTEHADVAEQLRAAQGEMEELRRVPPAAPAPSEDPELARLRQELTALRTRYTEQHPDVQSVRRRIAERETTAKAPPTERDTRVRAAEAQVEDLSARLARLELEMASLDSAREGRPARLEGQLESLERERTPLDEAHIALLREQTEVRLAEARARNVPTETFRVVGSASPPGRPHFPNPWLFSFVGLLAGLTAGLAAASVAEARDPSVKSVGDLEGLLQLPVLAEIPFAPRRPVR